MVVVSLPKLRRLLAAHWRLVALLLLAFALRVAGIGWGFLGRGTSLVAALFLAVSYNHAVNSQIATLDAGMTFFFALSFYFALKVFEKRKLKDYLLAGPLRVRF